LKATGICVAKTSSTCPEVSGLGEEDMMCSKTLGVLVAASGLFFAACAAGPKTAGQRAGLKIDAESTLTDMVRQDPSLRPILHSAAGYVVFPSVGQGGALVGGASGKGVVYERGQPVGFADLSQVSIGAQLGGQRFAELIVLRDQWALDRFKSGSFDVGGQASAVIIRSGEAAASQFGRNGVAVFIRPLGGAMFNVSLTGQQIRYTL
jgi:lipid-binding SYLF domain-containing protein